MPHNRYYLDTPRLTIGDTVSLGQQEEHHLIRVMRARPGDTIELINGKGELALCSVKKTENQKGILQIDSVTTEPPLSSITIALSLLKPSSLEWAIEKGAELGATSFWLFPSCRSEKKELSSHQKERLKAITISATKQCGRLYIPEITYKQELKKLDLNNEIQGAVPLLCDLKAPFLASINLKTQNPLILFVGPEGGFTEEERSIVMGLPNAVSICLNPNILRAETAPLAALSILRCL